MSSPSDPFPPIVESLRRAAAALRDAGVRFALGGSLACWARGGPETTNDLDLVVVPRDADAALAALEAAGMRTERPPEGWLYKAWDGAVLIDVIFELISGPVTDRMLEEADELNVAAVPMRVLTLEEVLTARLLALDEHHLDLGPLVLIARALREQIDWPQLRRRTQRSPYARGLFALLEELEVVARGQPTAAPLVTVRAGEGPAGAIAFGPAAGEPH